jgi:hypothetical protein
MPTGGDKPKVVNVKLVGCAYKNGFRMPGWATASLSDGRELYVPEEKAVGFSGVLEAVKDRADVEEYRGRLDVWVRTGTMPGAR